MKVIAALVGAIVLVSLAWGAADDSGARAGSVCDGPTHARPAAAQQACALPTQVDLLAGISDAGYLGPTLPVVDAIAGVDDVVERIWIHDRFAGPGDLTWRVWAPGLPSAVQGFTQLEFGEAYFVIAKAAATWEFPTGVLPATPTSVELVAGGNNVLYLGADRPVESVQGVNIAALRTAQTSPIERIWRLDFRDLLMPWRVWAPGLPDAVQGFVTVEFGRVYFVIAAEPLDWPFPSCAGGEEPEAQDLSGEWSFIVTVTREEGVCSGEAGMPYGQGVTVTQEGMSITLSGLGGANDPWTGTFVDGVAEFGGTRPEDGGLTTALFTMTVAPDGQSMSGSEAWTWMGPGGFCPNGESDVTAIRVDN